MAGGSMQDESVLLAVVIHGIVALGCVVGGLVALLKGYSVYRDHGHDGNAKMLVQMPWLKITAQSFGAVVMATAVAWAGLGVHVAPDIKASPRRTEVYSFVTEKGSVDVPVVSAAVSPASAAQWLRPTPGLGLVDAFTESVRTKNAATLAISGKPADIEDVRSVTIGGRTFLLATLKSQDLTAVVRYDTRLLSAKSGEAKVVFKPLSAAVLTTTTPPQ
jgi:hypothetical protein